VCVLCGVYVCVCVCVGVGGYMMCIEWCTCVCVV